MAVSGRSDSRRHSFCGAEWRVCSTNIPADGAKQGELGVGCLGAGLDGGVAAAEQGVLGVEYAKEVGQPASILHAGDRGSVGIGSDQRVERGALALARGRQGTILLDLAERGEQDLAIVGTASAVRARLPSTAARLRPKSNKGPASPGPAARLSALPERILPSVVATNPTALVIVSRGYRAARAAAVSASAAATRRIAAAMSGRRATRSEGMPIAETPRLNAAGAAATSAPISFGPSAVSDQRFAIARPRPGGGILAGACAHLEHLRAARRTGFEPATGLRRSGPRAADRRQMERVLAKSVRACAAGDDLSCPLIDTLAGNQGTA